MTETQALEIHEQAQQLQIEGRHEEALPLFDQVAEYFRSAEGPQSPDLANVWTDRAESLLALCHYQAADDAARQAVEIVEAIAPLLAPETRATLLPRALSTRGATLRELGRYAEAEVPLLAAIREAEMGANPTDVASHLNNYGVLCKYWGKFDEGERVYRWALAILEEAFGVDSVETATIHHNLGGLEHSRGHYAAGEPMARRAYQIRKAAFGDGDERTIADAVAWGGLLDGLGRQAESLPIYERALMFYRQRYGGGHFEVAATLHNLGAAYGALGRREEGIAALSRALEIKVALFGENDHPEVRITRAALDLSNDR